MSTNRERCRRQFCLQFPLSEPNANVQSDQPSQLEPDSYLFLTASDRQINFATFLHEHAFDAPFRESRRRLTIDRGNQIVSLQAGIRPWRVRYNLSDSEHFDAAQIFLSEYSTFAFYILRETYCRILDDEMSQLQALQASKPPPVFAAGLYIDGRFDRLRLCKQSVLLDRRSS